MKLNKRDFEEVVLSALRHLPKSFKRKMDNIDVVVEDQASPGLVEEMELRSPHELLGLYQGIPFDRRGFYYGNALPDKITLFKMPIEATCDTREEIEERVKEVIIHEVGHYFGLDEGKLRKIEHGEEPEE